MYYLDTQSEIYTLLYTPHNRQVLTFAHFQDRISRLNLLANLQIQRPAHFMETQ